MQIWKRAFKQFLENLGFPVKGEIGGCDLVGIAEGALPQEKAARIIACLKRHQPELSEACGKFISGQ
jgi:hypothetical protein